MTKDQIELLNSAVSDAVLAVLRDKPQIDLSALSQTAVNVVKAMAAGFAAIQTCTTSDAGHPASGI